MSEHTSIAWTDSTWGRWWGCTEVSEDCINCYAKAMAAMYGRAEWGNNKPRTILSEANARLPYKWDRLAAAGRVGKDGKRWLVFVEDMGDLFDPYAPDKERQSVWDTISRTPHLTYQVLTKRPENFKKFLPPDWGNGYGNVWLGVSVGNRKNGYPRIDILRDTPAKVRFLSCEPLLEDLVGINLTSIDWLIVGGESGHHARRFDLSWARNLHAACKKAHVKFFMKQLGSEPVADGSSFPILQPQTNGKKDVHGKCSSNFPDDLRAMEWPNQDTAA